VVASSIVLLSLDTAILAVETGRAGPRPRSREANTSAAPIDTLAPWGNRHGVKGYGADAVCGDTVIAWMLFMGWTRLLGGSCVRAVGS